MNPDQPKTSGSGVNEQKALDRPIAYNPTTQKEQEEKRTATELSKLKNQSGELSMQVRVYSPFRDYFDGYAFSISAVDQTGPFDILPKHHNFISLLSPCEIVIRPMPANQPIRITISGGILHVKADQVIVFLDV